MVIRGARPEEYDDLVELWLRASREAHDFVPFDFWQARAQDMRQVHLPGAATSVCEVDRQIAGFVSLVDGYLAALFVEPALHGQGIGRALLQFAQSRHGRLELTVFSENTRAVRFYLAAGFQVIEAQVDPHTGRPEQVMRWIRD